METQQEAPLKQSESFNEVVKLIKGTHPLVYVVTHEERRLIESLTLHFSPGNADRKVLVWSSIKGLETIESYLTPDHTGQATGKWEGTFMIPQACKAIANLPELGTEDCGRGHVIVMRDLHLSMGGGNVRAIRDILDVMTCKGISIVITAPRLGYGPEASRSGISPELERYVTVVNFELPSLHQIQNQIDSFLKETLKEIGDKDKSPLKTRLKYTQEELLPYCRALQGLTYDEVKKAVWTSLKSECGLSLNRFIEDKKAALRQTDILEFIEADTSIENDIGGMDQVKDFFKTYTEAFSDEAKEYGVEALRGVLLTGIAGCISGETILQYNRGSRPGMRDITMKNLYERFNGLSNRYQWDIDLSTRLYSFNGESELVSNRILGVFEAGIKPVVTVHTEEGSPITLTGDHPMCLTTGEFRPAGSLEPGDKLLMKGSMKARFNGGKKVPLRTNRKLIETLKYHPYGSTHMVNGYSYQRVNYARLVVEAHMNGVPPGEFLFNLKKDPVICKEYKFLEPSYDVHHIDENSLNDDISNLMILTHEGHAQLHAKRENFNVDFLKEGTVSKVEAHDTPIMTYDVQMEFPNNNFVANKYVIHNTGKSLFAKCISNLWGLPTVRLDIGKVMGGLVGLSEQNMRSALRQAESISPCIVWIEELEKAMSGTGSSDKSDGGTTSRVFGTLLTWMQECKKDIVVVATANDISKLPPELIRRFDELFFADLPTANERKEILNIHLTKRKKSISSAGLKKVVVATNKYTGAELEKTVKRAIALSFFDGKRKLTTKDLLTAAKEIKPLAIVMAPQIDEMRDWARTRARYSSSEAEKRAKPGAQTVTTSGGEELDLESALDDMPVVKPTPSSSITDDLA